jgi:hypothetical protein
MFENGTALGCQAGSCLANVAPGGLVITLDNPANLVGGYLYKSGYVDVGYYDAVGALVGSGLTISIDNGVGVYFFFDFESLNDPIKTILIDAGSGPGPPYNLDNFTTEIVTPLPAALPLFTTGLGALGLFGWRRKRKNSAALATGGAMRASLPHPSAARAIKKAPAEGAFAGGSGSCCF